MDVSGQLMLVGNMAESAFPGSCGGGVRRAVKVVLDPSVRSLCTRAYPGHRRGCPNYGRRDRCPPAAPLLGKVLDLHRPVWIAWNAFDLAGHVGRLREKHPQWSVRQLRCCLYWQQGARRQLDIRIRAFQRDRPGLVAVRTPEACGVNVTETMRAAALEIEWPPRRVVRQVALLGLPASEADGRRA